MYDHVKEDGRTYHRYKEGSKVSQSAKADVLSLTFQNILCQTTMSVKPSVVILFSSVSNQVMEIRKSRNDWVSMTLAI
jgi:hypothetical protein